MSTQAQDVAQDVGRGSARGDLTAPVLKPSPSSRPATAQMEPLPKTASLLLDVVRFGLCLLVLLGHMTLPAFSQGWPSLMTLANGAVPGFFVLSGFVIRFVTSTRERQASRYWISRAARIYSVALPAIALTVALDAVSRHANPEFYRHVTSPEPWSSVPVRIAAALLFVTQAWGHAGLLLSNTPFWSLGYEVPYYILFGIATFARGGRRVLLLAGAALLFGPQVLFLLPIWWSGIWLFDAWQWLRQPGRDVGLRAGASLVAIAVVAWLLLPIQGRNGFTHLQNLPNPLALVHLQVVRASMFEYAACLLSWALLLLLLCASDLVHLPAKTVAARSVRWIAEGTFTLYLFHFPMLLCAAALHLYRPDHAADKMVLMMLIGMFCIGAAVPVDRFKCWLRDRLLSFGRTAAH